jgi:hypothetical protein
MKNFTPIGRLLLLAVFLFSAIGLSAQTVCGINGPVTITAEPACQGGFPAPQPHVIVDLGPGSGLINGPINVTVQPVYNNIFPGPPVEVQGAIASSGIIAFETPDNSVFAGFNIKIRLIEITIVGQCTQNFENSPLESLPFSMLEQSGIQSITKNTTRSVDPPCAGVATGRISANIIPASGTPTATRFSAEIYPSGAFVQVFGPNSGPNNDPFSYLVETTASLEAGSYDIIISDNQSPTGCVVVYNAMVGDPNNTLTAQTSAQSASCFGVADGSITVGVAPTIDPQVNGTIFVEYTITNGFPLQVGQLPVNNITNQYEPFTISNLPTGTYNVSLTSSATGCSDNMNVFVPEPAEIMVTASADPVCADAGSFDFTLTGVSGLDPNARYRLIDASFFDPAIANNGCWTRPASGRAPIAPGLQGDGSYLFTVGLASTPGCYSVNQDTLVTLYLELLNPNGCRDTFSFPLQINAKPLAPVVDATATVGTDLINDFYCSGQDIDLDIADYDPAFTYEITYTELAGVVPGGAAAANDTFAYVDGSTLVSFMNNNNFLATIDFEVTKTDAATGCVSASSSFSTRVRPEPVITAIPGDVLVCSGEEYLSGPIEVNNGSNSNLTYNYAWSFDFNTLSFSGVNAGTQSNPNNSVTGTFTNTSGIDQVATLTVTPVFQQTNNVIGGGTVDNTCEGEAMTIEVTVSAQPELAANLVIGQNVSTTLTSGETVAEEICSGETFALDQLMINEVSGTKAKFVRLEVEGDATFLNIPQGQADQFFAIGNFAINVSNVTNTSPINSAQVATLTLTPYFEDDAGSPGSNPLECAGDPITVILTINPTPPVIANQAVTVCSGERVMYPIATGSNGSNLETRLTTVTTFDGVTEFMVPEGANRIEDFTFTITGADGGAANGNNGGRGGELTATLSDTELLPGDVVRVRKGTAGESGATSGNGGDATTLVVIAGGNHLNITAGTELYRFVAGGGGGAGFAQSANDVFSFNDSNAAGDGGVGQGGGGAGGTGFPTSLGGDGMTNGGGGGGGWNGGNGGSSLAGDAGVSGTSFAESGLAAPVTFTFKSSSEADGEVIASYTIVYDEIRFSLASPLVIPAGLMSMGETIVDGEVDTILFGQQFINPTNDPLDVTYVFNTSTEANCDDGGTVEVVVTIAPEPTAFLADAGTDVTVDANGNYTATVCSGDAIDALIGTMVTPPVNYNTAYVNVSEQLSTNTDFGTFGSNTTSGRINLAAGSPVAFNQAGVFNNTGVDQTITYTIEPFIARPGQVNCASEPFTFTVTVQPGFSVDMNQPIVNVCSRDMLSDGPFDLDASQPNINVNFDLIRVAAMRFSPVSAEFTISDLDTTGLAAGGFTLNRTDNFFNDAIFTNRRGAGVVVEFDVVFISDDGCESQTVTYPFNIRAEPIIDESNTAITICEGDATGLTVLAAANSAFFNNFSPTQVTFSYTLDAGNLTYTGNNLYPLSGGATMFQGDTFDNPTSMPQTATYTVVATSQFGCASQPVTYEVTVLPRPELALTATQATTTVTGQEQQQNIETLTICSGSSVDFALSQDVTGTNVSYRIQRTVTGSITNGDGSAVDNFEGGLPIANFQETLVNMGTGAASVQYKLEAYTFGRNGLDDNGLSSSDDCVGISQRVIVEVLPDNSDPSDLVVNYFRDGNFVNPTPAIDSVCAGTMVTFGPGTALDVSSGMNVRYSITNDAGLSPVMGFGNNPFSNNGVNFFGPFSSVLDNDGTSGITYTVLVELYSFGSNGADDELSGDDCVGTTRTITIFVEPQPVLNGSLTVGAQSVTVESGEDYFFELCSGDDFRLGELDFLTDDLATRANFVSFSISGATASEFLNLGTQNGQLLDIDGFLIGSSDVRNTSGAPYIAEITLVPFYNDPSTVGQSDDCSGEEINITVVLNPEVTGVMANQSATFCSDEDTRYQISGGTNTFESVVVLGSDFETTQEVVLPVGAARIEGISFEVTGANGGDATQSNTTGGVGVRAIGTINDGNALPGDTIRVIKGIAGGSGTLAGDGGGGSALLLIGGPMRAANFQGAVLDRVVVAGGGGAGLQENSVTTLQTTTLDSPGADGAGPGGNGGQNGPSYAGGTGVNNGGGGGGGRVGGNGGDSQSGDSGSAGQSFLFRANNPVGSATTSLKTGTDAEDGEASISYQVVFDDVQFTVASKTVAPGLVPAATGLIMGSTGTDTLLYDENFSNPTDGALDVVYVLNTATEANCPGSQIEVTLTIEPNPTFDFAGNGTMVNDDGNNNFFASICSGDGLSATLSSDVIPSNGASFLRARVLTSTMGAGTVTFDATDNDAASQTGFFNGNNQPSVADVDFFETAINYSGTDTATVTYQIIPVIISSSNSGAECFGDTITFTVSVFPAFDVVTTPVQTSVCSNVSLEDAGFDPSASQPITVTYDSIIIDTVETLVVNGNSMDFDTVSSVYNGVPITVVRSQGFFNDDVYRNRTGGPVFVTYTVRLVSGPGCTSDPIEYEFRYTAEPVIDIVESATNQIDTTICSGDMTGLTVTPAANSAFPTTTGANAFQNRITIEYDIIDQPAGLVLSNSTNGYPFTAGRNYFRDDVWTNNTSGPLDVKYSVNVTNGTCAGDSVVYTVTVNPNPFVDVTLTSLDSTETFGLDNATVGGPDPEFGMCSGQAISATIPSASTSAAGMLMVNFRVTAESLPGLSGYAVGTTRTFPASELADSLSFEAGDLMNTTAISQSFTVRYRTFIEANGTPGYQNDGVDCVSEDPIQFVVVVNPTNGAFAQTEADGTSAPFAVGTDTLCSGEVFDFLVRNTMSTGIPVDSFVVEVISEGLEPVGSTPTGTFTIDGAMTATNGVRSQDFAFTNTTPGIDTVIYNVTPYSGACAGPSATARVMYRAEIDLVANEPVLCADPGVATSLFAIDANGGMISDDRNEYRYEYIGGTASGYSLERGAGGGVTFVGDPVNQANTIVYNNQRSVIITPSSNAAAFTPGTVNFEVIYDDTDNGCGIITDTITLNFQTTAVAGMADQGLGILCDEVNFVLDGALIGADQGGVYTFTNGDPGLGALNGANFTPMVGGSDPTPVAIDFTYTVGGGNSGCALASVDFSIMVEPAPNAGTYDGTVGEACEAAPAFNVFDLLDGEMQNGTFTQTAGTDFVTVNPDGTIDQDNITPDLYEFSYEVMSANGCGSDMVTGIMVQVNSLMGCSTTIACDTIDLNPGFNVISFDVLPNDRSVESVFAAEIANNTLLTVIAIHPDEQASAQLYSFNPTFGTVSSGITALRPGYGYVVEMASTAQVITCGTAVDSDIRVELQSGLNIVGYVAPGTESIFDYFSVLIGANDVNLIRTIESGILRQLRFNPNPSGNLFRVRNSNGYLLDINSAYTEGTWREGEVMPTSNFDRLFGYTNLSEETAGQAIRFTDVDGNVYGRAELRADGTYDDVMLYGDLAETARQREGLEQGEEIYAEFQGQRIATGETFSGSWNLRQLDLNFNTETEAPDVAEDFAMSVFPNPTVGDVQVKLALEQEYDLVRVEVYSLLGQLVIERNLQLVQAGNHQIELNFNDLAAGTYQVRITTEDGVKGHAQIIRK